jgi:3-hydroxyisobutyrate dehydrogenase
MTEISTVAVLGAGALGAAIADRLAQTGHPVRVWNRTPARAQAVAAGTPGVVAADTVALAVRGASVVLTVLRDGNAVAAVMMEALPAFDDGAVWVQASTVGPDSALKLSEMAGRSGVAFLDAPVSGSTGPAHNGKLIWLVAGEQRALELATPVLRDLGTTIDHLGTGVEGSAVKLAVNAWMTATTVAMSDTLALCDSLGVDHVLVMQALQGGPLAMPYALQKATAMDEQAYTAGFAISLALKDLDLAAKSRTPTPLFAAVHERLAAAIAAGHGDDDVAAVDYQRHPIS